MVGFSRHITDSHICIFKFDVVTNRQRIYINDAEGRKCSFSYIVNIKIYFVAGIEDSIWYAYETSILGTSNSNIEYHLQKNCQKSTSPWTWCQKKNSLNLNLSTLKCRFEADQQSLFRPLPRLLDPLYYRSSYHLALRVQYISGNHSSLLVFGCLSHPKIAWW